MYVCCYWVFDIESKKECGFYYCNLGIGIFCNSNYMLCFIGVIIDILLFRNY